MFDVEDARLQLEEMTLTAYYDYYLAHRQLELNAENLGVVEQFRATAESRYRTNQVTQQDISQADVELANLERRKIELEQLDHVTQARINVLLQVDPVTPLPAPPASLELPHATPNEPCLQQLALSQRPDLAGLRARAQEAQASVALASKEYYPDTEVFGRYDAMWQEKPLQPAVGVNLNLPIYRNRLDAAVREAQFSLSQRRAELEQRLLDVQYEVAAAYERVEASRKMLELYDRRLIPAAEQNRNAARSNYDVSKTTYFELAAAQRQLISLREEREQTLVDYFTRLAQLQRAIGGEIPFDTKQIRVEDK
jgi:outer membrane protein TolC